MDKVVKDARVTELMFRIDELRKAIEWIGITESLEAALSVLESRKEQFVDEIIELMKDEEE